MIRKLMIISFLLILPAFLTTCNDSSSDKAKVTIDLSGVDAVKKLTGVTSVSKAVGSTVPVAIDTIEIIVKNDDGDVVYDSEFYRDEFEATGTLSLEVQSGENMEFTAKGKDITRFLIYEGAAAETVDLAPGEDETVSIIMTEAEPPALDAQVTLNLLDEDGTPLTAAKAYFNGSPVLQARIFRPTAVTDPITDEETVQLGDPVSNVTSGFSATISGLLAYPDTYQVIVVCARANDTTDTISAIGSVIVANLDSGANGTIDVRMVRPVPLIIRNTEAITSVNVEMNLGGTVTVADTAFSGLGTTEVTVLVPNRMPDIKLRPDTVSDEYKNTTVNRTISININGESVELSEYSMTDKKYLRWKTTIYDVSTNIWSLLEE